MLKHMKTEIEGVWLEPPPEEEPAQDQEPRPEAEGQESVEDEGYDGVVKTGVDDENVDVIPEEQEEPSQDQKPPPEAECQEPYGGVPECSTSSWVHIQLNEAVEANDEDSQATMILGEHLREDEDVPMPPVAEGDEASGHDSLVDKVMDDLEAVNLDPKSKPVTMPPVPGKPFLERELDLGTAMGSTGPEGRRNRKKFSEH